MRHLILYSALMGGFLVLAPLQVFLGNYGWAAADVLLALGYLGLTVAAAKEVR